MPENENTPRGDVNGASGNREHRPRFNGPKMTRTSPSFFFRMPRSVANSLVANPEVRKFLNEGYDTIPGEIYIESEAHDSYGLFVVDHRNSDYVFFEGAGAPFEITPETGERWVVFEEVTRAMKKLDAEMKNEKAGKRKEGGFFAGIDDSMEEEIKEPVGGYINVFRDEDIDPKVLEDMKRDPAPYRAPYYLIEKEQDESGGWTYRRVRNPNRKDVLPGYSDRTFHFGDECFRKGKEHFRVEDIGLEVPGNRTEHVLSIDSSFFTRGDKADEMTSGVPVYSQFRNPETGGFEERRVGMASIDMITDDMGVPRKVVRVNIDKKEKGGISPDDMMQLCTPLALSLQLDRKDIAGVVPDRDFIRDENGRTTMLPIMLPSGPSGGDRKFLFITIEEHQNLSNRDLVLKGSFSPKIVYPILGACNANLDDIGVPVILVPGISFDENGKPTFAEISVTTSHGDGMNTSIIKAPDSIRNVRITLDGGFGQGLPSMGEFLGGKTSEVIFKNTPETITSCMLLNSGLSSVNSWEIRTPFSNEEASERFLDTLADAHEKGFVPPGKILFSNGLVSGDDTPFAKTRDEMEAILTNRQKNRNKDFDMTDMF